MTYQALRIDSNGTKTLFRNLTNAQINAMVDDGTLLVQNLAAKDVAETVALDGLASVLYIINGVDANVHPVNWDVE